MSEISQFTKKLEHNPDANAMQKVMFTPDGQLLTREDRNHLLSEIVAQNRTDFVDFQRRAASGKTQPDETPVVPFELTDNSSNVTLKVAGANATLYADIKNYAKGAEEISMGDKVVSVPFVSSVECRPSVQYPGMQECVPKPRT